MDMEMREATFPDGGRGVIAVKPGLLQDEVDLLAAAAWAEMPERPSGGDGGPGPSGG